MIRPFSMDAAIDWALSDFERLGVWPRSRDT
jgi:hypothetical protein